MLVDELSLDRNEPSPVSNAGITRNQKYEDVYLKRFEVFMEHEKIWNRYHKVNAKLRDCILLMVASQKKATLHTIYPVR